MRIQVLVDSRDAEAARFRGFAAHRARFATRGLTRMILRVEACLSTNEGPRDEATKRCSIRLATDIFGDVTANALGCTWPGAVDDALNLAIRGFLRACRDGPSYGSNR